VTKSETGAAKLRTGEKRRTPNKNIQRTKARASETKSIDPTKLREKSQNHTVNKNNFSVEIKTDSNTTIKITVLPPSFDWNENEFLIHFYSKNMK
jgi:hypothetical protein